MIKKLLPTQDFDEQERISTAMTLRVIVIVSMIGAFVALLAVSFLGRLEKQLPLQLAMGTLLALLAVSLYFIQKGNFLLARFLTPLILYVSITFLLINGYGLHTPAIVGYGGVIVAASLTLGQGGSFLFAGLIIITAWVMGYLEINGLFITEASQLTHSNTPIFFSILILAITFIQRALLNLRDESLKHARINEREQAEANKKLTELQSSLESRVEERTAELSQRTQELEVAGQQIQRRVSQFEALAQVAQSISTIRNPKELLSEVTQVISKYYNFYHVGVFLVDEAREYAVLTETNSEGGKRMLDRKHRLKIGEQGIVGSVTAIGEARIALDVGNEATYFNNPDLPNTHSEMALPLKIGNQVIGALDVQSTETAAFSNEDVQTLGLLADQVSLAIENARLFENLNKTLGELQTVSRQSVREAWKRTPERLNILGYKYDSMGAAPLKEPVSTEKNSDTPKHQNRIETPPFVVPIEIRGEVIGELLVQSPLGEDWNEDQQDLIRAVAERVALSAENARLFEETTQRAERERLVSEITSKIRSHNNPQSMIETAVNELREALGATRVEIISQSTEKKDTEV